MELNWLEIAIAAILCSAVVAFVVVQILRLMGKLTPSDAEKAEEYIAKWVSIGVYAAEQLYGAKTGEQKLAYVKKLLTALGIEVTEPVLAMIEASVYNLKQKALEA